jgi:hypothetical protein
MTTACRGSERGVVAAEIPNRAPTDERWSIGVR